MLKLWLTQVLACVAAASIGGCTLGAAQKPAPELPQRPVVARPTWLELVPSELEAVRACVTARAPEPALAVHVQPLNELRTGVITLGLDGSVERCVHRIDLIEYRARAHDMRAADFAGQPAVWAAASRPEGTSGTYVEEIVRAGVTVAWVQWLGTGGRR